MKKAITVLLTVALLAVPMGFAPASAEGEVAVNSISINAVEGVVSNVYRTVHVTLPAGTDVRALTPVFELPDGAAVSPDGARDFTEPQVYEVTAAGGAKAAYTVTVSLFDGALAGKRPLRIYCVGDSITRGAGMEQGNGSPYPTLLQNKLNQRYGSGAFTVRNGGRDGYGVQKNTVFPAEEGAGSGYYGKDANWQDVVSFAPDVILFALGANNAKNTGAEKSWVDEETFRADYRELLEKTLALPTKPLVVVGTAMRIKGNGNFNIVGNIIENSIVPIQREIAAQLGLPVVDGFAFSESILADGYNTDNVHLNAVGYEKMAALYFDFFCEMYDGWTDSAPHSFTVNGVAGTVHAGARTVTVELPAGTDVTALTPVITKAAGTTLRPAELGVRDFTEPQRYTLTAPDGTVAAYTAIVTAGPVPPLESIALNGDYMALAVGSSAQLRVQFTPAVAAADVVWSSDSDYLEVTPDGVVTAWGGGHGTVTAAVGDRTASCRVELLVTGDVNLDGEVDSTDARMVLQHEVGLLKLGGAAWDNADVDGYHTVDSTDARMILQYEVGLLRALPADEMLKIQRVPADGVTLTAKQATYTGDTESVEVVWRNDTDVEYLFGDPFSLERLTDGVWQVVSEVESVHFNAIGYMLPPHSTREQTYNMRLYTAHMAPGQYRVKTDYLGERVDDLLTEYVLCAEFTVV